MSKNETIRIRANKRFVTKLNELYPQDNSYNNKTLKLNRILEDMIHGKKNE